MIEYLVYAAVAAMFVFGLGPMLWSSLRARRLRALGLPARARVLTITDTRSRVNGNPVVELQLSVETAGGQTYTTLLRTAISPVDLPRHQPGMMLEVVVDRQDRQRVVLAKGD